MPRRRRAFTLIEIMVAIGIVALAIAIAFPALSGVQRSGRRSTSLNNLRQMALAAQQYVVFHEAWPAAVRYENGDAGFTTIAWDWAQVHATGETSPGPLWQFTGNPDEVMQCPEFAGSSTFGSDPFTGYNYNTSYIGAVAPFPATGWEHVRRGVPPSGCRRTSTTALFGAGGWSGGANKFMRAPENREGMALDTLYAGGQAFRYLGDTTVVAYIDAHIATVNRAHEGVLATDAVLETSMGFPDNGFLSDDDRAYDPR